MTNALNLLSVKMHFIYIKGSPRLPVVIRTNLGTQCWKMPFWGIFFFGSSGLLPCFVLIYGGFTAFACTLRIPAFNRTPPLHSLFINYTHLFNSLMCPRVLAKTEVLPKITHSPLHEMARNTREMKLPRYAGIKEDSGSDFLKGKVSQQRWQVRLQRVETTGQR